MTTTTARWVKFFLDAGLPQNIATTYAITFTDHRIHIDMLPDLSKEILYDMGIKTVGDVIAILKYAKSFHGEATKEKMLGRTVGTSNSPQSGGGDQSRLLKRIVTAPPAPSSRSEPVKRSSSQAFEPQQQSKIRLVSSSEGLRSSAAGLSPETKPFVVKMPAGSTERSARILKTAVSQATSNKSNASSSIFSRLGNDSNDGNAQNKTAVFSRLGGASSSNPTITTNPGSKMIRTISSTQNPVRSSTSNSKITATVKPTNLLVRSVEEANLSAQKMGRPVLIKQSTAPINVSVKNRLGVSSSSASSIVPITQRLTLGSNKMSSSNAPKTNSNGSMTISTRPTIQKTSAGILTSSGGAAKRTISLKKNVFDRLGPMTL